MKKRLSKFYLKLIVLFLFLIFLFIPIVLGYSSKELSIPLESFYDPMDSPWPMKCHDVRHTGRSPYSTADNPGIEKWRFKCGVVTGWVQDSAVIAEDGTIYFGVSDGFLYALTPNGILKWEYRIEKITSAPAIDEDGTIYIGAWDDCFHSVNPDGTLKWKFDTDANIASSPAIAEDGTIYFGTLWSLGDGGKLYALNPDGSEKWNYQTNDSITSDPAIGEDGTIYVGSLDSYLYALYPNGTLNWKFKTNGEIKSPCSIADDGTIYFGSFDDYIYALYPNGTLKWKTYTEWGTSANPSIDEDGTIYVGTDNLYALNPDGSIKWAFDLGYDRRISFSSPAISADGTIYFGVIVGDFFDSDGGEIISLDSDGTERWRKKIADYRVDSSPCISEDGTVYIGSSFDQGRGYLHAFGAIDSNVPPEKPIILGETNGDAGERYWYEFSAIDHDNNPVYFYIDWGDSTIEEWIHEGASGESVWAEHTYNESGTYTISAKARDSLNEESDWGTLTVTMPWYKPTSIFYWFLEQHPRLFPLLRQLFIVPE